MIFVNEEMHSVSINLKNRKPGKMHHARWLMHWLIIF